MSRALDASLRELERRWRAYGDVEAGTTLLLALHRRDALEEVRLRLAAHLGDPAALAVAGELLGVVPRRQNVAGWIRAIGKPDHAAWPRPLDWTPLVRPACARAALAACELALPAWREEGDAEDVETTEATLEDVRAWLAAPSKALEERILGRFLGGGLGGLTGEVALELGSVVLQPIAPGARSPCHREQETARAAARVVESALRVLSERDGRRAAEAELRAAIRRETLPWILELEWATPPRASRSRPRPRSGA